MKTSKVGEMAQTGSGGAPDTNTDRIAYLDGLRGVAVLSVMAWHYTNWGYRSFFPYGTLYSPVPILDHGWIGVNLFFLISGFVILMTLERCHGFAEFMARRWSRLFPAMLLASLLIFGISQFAGAFMPHGRAAPLNLLPGLSFIIPTAWSALLGQPVDELDGVFWTLYVEMGFYVSFGLLFFRLGWRKGLPALAALWLLTITASRLATAAELPWLGSAVTPLQWIGAEYYGWFVAGALFFKSREHRSDRLFWLAMLAGLISAASSDLWQPGDAVSRAYLVGCVGFFALTHRSASVRALLGNKGLLHVGFASYPLYLLHNELGIGFIKSAALWLPVALWPLLPWATMAMMVGVAWLIAQGIETPATQWLRAKLLRAVGPRDAVPRR